ncbi:hypothetical protein BUALT_Bualt17G0016300 [Buddleja alternifolia]|uniref:DUF4283 domain-containing protein n=1 Tax=Buddleja alternifolia TaxID=168488 RepID=A0AAV6WFU7_9LAMI|nr:hypothetical protein BUALT_Bualt17G0016300 [Buddleja alternifolia]
MASTAALKDFPPLHPSSAPPPAASQPSVTPPLHRSFAETLQEPPLSTPSSPRAKKKSIDDLEEGFGSPRTLNGVPGLFFSKEEITNMCVPFKYTLVGKFGHGMPPLARVRVRFVKMKLRGFFQVGLINPSHVLINLSCEEDYTRVWLRQEWLVDGFSIRIFKWCYNMSYHEESPIVPVWVNLPELPIVFFHKKALRNIACILGKPLKLDEATVDRYRLEMARICIECLDKSKDSVRADVLEVASTSAVHIAKGINVVEVANVAGPSPSLFVVDKNPILVVNCSPDCIKGALALSIFSNVQPMVGPSIVDDVKEAVNGVIHAVYKIDIEGVLGSNLEGHPADFRAVNSNPILENVTVDDSLSCSSDLEDFSIPIKNSFEALGEDTVVEDSLIESSNFEESTHSSPSISLLAHRTIQCPDLKQNTSSSASSSLNLIKSFTARNRAQLSLKNARATPFAITAVYAKCTISARRELWDGLRDVATYSTTPWIIGRDFNTVLNVHERKGFHLPKLKSMKEFGDMIVGLSTPVSKMTILLASWSSPSGSFGLVAQSIGSQIAGSEEVSNFFFEGRWDHGRLSRIVLYPMLKCICSMEFDILKKDLMVWKLSSNGNFSFKDTWELIRSPGVPNRLLKDIWNNCVIPTMSTFIWRLINNWIPVDERMQSKGF